MTLTTALLTVRTDKKCGKSGIPDNRKCTKQTSGQAATTIEKQKSGGGIDPRLLTGAAGVLAVGTVLGVVARDVYSSGVPKEKVPPMEPPEGLYDTFKPGDLIYQTAEFAGANRAHYAVYVGKVDGEHKVFDTSAQTIKGKQTSKMQLRTLTEATGSGTSFALASRVDKNSRKPTSEELEKIIKRLNNKSFDWTGFESNCETLARSIVNDLPVSTQSKDVTGMTNFLAKTMISAMAPKGYRARAVKQENINRLVKRTVKSDQNDKQRIDKKCGASGIPDNAKCHKGIGSSAVTTGLVVAGLAAGGLTAAALMGGGSKPKKPKPSDPKVLTGKELAQNKLPGITPRALLAPAPKRKSKTERMRENTSAAMRNAEGRIAQTAREEIRRVGQIGNTMAAAGEATGMAAKTTLRELRLRAEAARRRYEPGYRSADKPKTPARLPQGGGLPMSTSRRSPSRAPDTLEGWGELASNPEAFRRAMSEGSSTDPRTGQPRRRRAQGFGRRDSLIQHYTPTQLQPPTRRDACWEGYEQVGMKRKGKRRVPNCVPIKKKTQADTEDGKKYSKTVTNPETGRKNKVSYGAKGYKIAPGTDKGDRYCARSFGDMKSHGKDCGGEDRNTPLCLSRAKWKCSGKTSRRDGLTPGKSSAW